MTRLADDLLRQSIGTFNEASPSLHVCEEEPAASPLHEADAA